MTIQVLATSVKYPPVCSIVPSGYGGRMALNSPTDAAGKGRTSARTRVVIQRARIGAFRRVTLRTASLAASRQLRYARLAATCNCGSCEFLPKRLTHLRVF